MFLQHFPAMIWLLLWTTLGQWRAVFLWPGYLSIITRVSPLVGLILRVRWLHDLIWSWFLLQGKQSMVIARVARLRGNARIDWSTYLLAFIIENTGLAIACCSSYACFWKLNTETERQLEKRKRPWRRHMMWGWCVLAGCRTCPSLVPGIFLFPDAD